MRFSSKQHVLKKENRRKNKGKHNVPITAGQSSGLLNQCFFCQTTMISAFYLFSEHARSGCTRSNEHFRKSEDENAPKKERGKRKAEEQFPIIAGETVGLLNQWLMPIYHNECHFFFV